MEKRVYYDLIQTGHFSLALLGSSTQGSSAHEIRVDVHENSRTELQKEFNRGAQRLRTLKLMDIILLPILNILRVILNLYLWIIILSVVMSWLISFGIINPYNRFVMMIHSSLSRLTEPLLQPLRRILPNLGGMDLSPLALGLGVILLSDILFRIQAALVL